MNDLIIAIENVVSEQAEIFHETSLLNSYLNGTEGLNKHPDEKKSIQAVVKVNTSEDIKALLQLANSAAMKSKLTIHPISSGLNWGYGSNQPAQKNDTTVIVDLSNLKAIHLDRELGLVTIEPGVTQQQLSDFLINLDDEYMVPVTGAGPDCSIIGNAIERGYGITPYTDHFGAVMSLEGFWANGDIYQSSIYELDETPEKLADKSYKWGLGPYLEGLFTQSNLGIVNQMTIRLSKKKPAFTSFFIQLPNDALLEQAAPLIQKVLSNYEGIVGSINLMDQRRLLSMFAENPNGGQHHKVMTNTQVEKLAKEWQAPCWTIVGSIYGSKKVVSVVRVEIRNIFSQCKNKSIYSDSLLIKIGNTAIKLLPQQLINSVQFLKNTEKQLDSFEKGKEIMLGKPNRVALKLAYWRHADIEKFKGNYINPAKDKCGLLWYAPLIPMKPKAMREFVNFVREICPKYNIEPFITFTNLRHDCVDSTIPITFDSTNPNAVNDAHNCLRELVEKGLTFGYIPYRLNIDQQQWLLDKNTPFWKTVNQIKSVLDPKSILSPGRYNPH